MARRRTREPRKSHRRAPQREAYARVLIVCEGTKTEPGYFREIIEEHQLSSANVVVTSGSGSDPKSVVDTAIQLYEYDSDYDEVYVVIDRDSHPGYDAAVNRIKNAPKNLQGVIELISSEPCFEYWLLLHFEETAKPYAREGGRSPCANVIRDLQGHLDYHKGGSGLFAATKGHLGKAKDRAARRLNDAEQGGSENPTTRIHLLVERLQTLRDDTFDESSD